MQAPECPGTVAGPGRRGGGHQTAVRICGDQPDPGQGTGDQVAEEAEPAGVDVVGIFPDRPSIIRLVDDVLAE